MCMLWSLGRCRSALRGERFPHEQDRAAADRTIGRIEYREVMALRVEIEEVDHGAEDETVDHVTDRATEDEAQGETEEHLRGMLLQQPHDPQRCCERER